MENRWIAEIQNASTPAEGSLTERALTQATVAKRVSLRPYALAGVALAVTLPIAWYYLPKKNAPAQETVQLAFGRTNPTNAISNPLPAIQTTAPTMTNPPRVTLNLHRANRITTQVQSNPTPAKLNPTGAIGNTAPAKANTLYTKTNPTGANLNPPKVKAIPPVAETQVALETGKRPEVFAYQPPGQQKTLSEEPRVSPAPAVVALQDKPTLEAVKEREAVQLSLQQVTAADASSASAGRILLSLAPRALSASAEPLNRSYRGLRYPLSPLPKVPQATTRKAELSVHADSSHAGGTVSLAPEKTERELLVAVFDQYGAPIATQKTPVPANAETVEIKPFVAPRASHYLLGVRPHFERDKSKLQIIGGYVGYEKHVEVPAPPGVEIGVGDANFYQSNVYKDHFVRFSATLSKKLLKQPFSEPSLTLYGIVVDDRGALLSVASEALKTKPGAQQLDLDFGLLPESVGRKYQFVVTSAYRLVLEPDASFTADSAKLEADGSMVLAPKPKEFPIADVLKKPELRDYTQVKLTPDVVKKLKAKGIADFKGMRIEASGKSEKALYLSRPPIEVTTVTVENVEDVTIQQKPDANFTVDSAKLESDGSLILMPKLKQFPGAEILKKPELRDYAQVKLTPGVVKALKAKGLTHFEGKHVEASGKTEKALILCYPSIEIMKVTVERVEDITFPEIEFEKP